MHEPVFVIDHRAAPGTGTLIDTIGGNGAKCIRKITDILAIVA